MAAAVAILFVADDSTIAFVDFLRRQSDPHPTRVWSLRQEARRSNNHPKTPLSPSPTFELLAPRRQIDSSTVKSRFKDRRRTRFTGNLKDHSNRMSPLVSKSGRYPVIQVSTDSVV